MTSPARASSSTVISEDDPIARLPGIHQVLQLISDAVGQGPRSVGETSVRA